MILATAPGCGLIFGGDQSVDNRSHDYTVVRLDRDTGGAWRSLKQDDGEGDLAFEHAGTGAIISVNSVCREYRDTSLEDLSRHLLLGLNTSGPIATRNLTIDSVPALESKADAIQNGEGIRVRAVVLRKAGCTYDLMHIARPGALERTAPDFDRFLKGFHVD